MTDGISKVVVEDITGDDLKDTLQSLFDRLGGIKSVIPEGVTVWLKPNGVHYGAEQYTSNNFIEAAFGFLKDNGYNNICLAENATAGNFTRLVYHVTGWFELCKKYGVEAVLLDEGPTVSVTLNGEERPVRFSKALCDALIEDREANFYMSIPKLKTHSMTMVTLGIKNQQGLISDPDRMYNHNHLVHERLVNIFRFIQPDFTLVDGQKGVIYGHFPAESNLDKSLMDTNLIIGGADTVSVDSVGAKIFGYSFDEVKHIRLAHEAGLGQGDLEKVEVIGDISRFTEKQPYEIMGIFPDTVTRIIGKDMACIEGCRGNAECAVEYYYCQFDGGRKKPFNLVCGKGFTEDMFEGLEGDFFISGSCAASEVTDLVKKKYPKAKVFVSAEHNDLSRMTGIVARLMRPKIGKMLPVSPFKMALLFWKARRKGLNSRIVTPF